VLSCSTNSGRQGVLEHLRRYGYHLTQPHIDTVAYISSCYERMSKKEKSTPENMIMIEV
jgi:hypothetical protein